MRYGKGKNPIVADDSACSMICLNTNFLRLNEIPLLIYWWFKWTTNRTSSDEMMKQMHMGDTNL